MQALFMGIDLLQWDRDARSGILALCNARFGGIEVVLLPRVNYSCG